MPAPPLRPGVLLPRGNALTVVLRLALLALLSLCAACGKKGALIPPDGFVPPPVSALQVVQQGDGFRISWLAPEEKGEAGSSPPAGFRVYRREVPAAAGACPACGDEQLIRTVDPEYLGDAVRLGNLFVVADSGVQPGKSYQYQVRAFDRAGGENRDSGRVQRKKVVPPPSPLVRIGEVPAGILLEWPPVRVTAGSLVGYTIYRLRPGERVAVTPLTPAPVTVNRYEDLRMAPDTVYRYQLRTVARVDGETVESAPSPDVEGKFVLP